MRRRVVWAAAAAAVTAVIGCHGAPEQETSGPTEVEVAVVRAEDVPVEVSTLATLEAKNSADIRAQVGGQIAALYADEGAAVKAGAPLLAIDPDRYRLALQSAEARLEQASAQYTNDSLTLARSTPLLATGGIGPQALDDLETRTRLSKAALDQARAARDLADQDYHNAHVRAPFAGRFAQRQVKIGDYVKVGDLLGVVADPSVLEVTFDLPETQGAAVKPGDAVTFTATAVPNRTFRGRVYYASPIVTPSTRTVTVKARVQNDNGALMPGMSAAVDVATRTLPHAAVVPEVAIRHEAGEDYVFRVARDTVSRVAVTVGPRPRPGDIVITNGVAVGDSLLVAGFQKVSNGTRVAPKLVSAPGENASP